MYLENVGVSSADVMMEYIRVYGDSGSISAKSLMLYMANTSKINYSHNRNKPFRYENQNEPGKPVYYYNKIINKLWQVLGGKRSGLRAEDVLRRFLYILLVCFYINSK